MAVSCFTGFPDFKGINGSLVEYRQSFAYGEHVFKSTKNGAVSRPNTFWQVVDPDVDFVAHRQRASPFWRVVTEDAITQHPKRFFAKYGGEFKPTMRRIGAARDANNRMTAAYRVPNKKPPKLDVARKGAIEVDGYSRSPIWRRHAVRTSRHATRHSTRSLTKTRFCGVNTRSLPREQ